MSEHEEVAADPYAESRAEAERILTLAGWKHAPGATAFAAGTLVGGIQPDGQQAHVKDWAKIQPGHPQYGPDTPDTPHEAAAWLVARFAPKLAEPRYRYRRKLAAEEAPVLTPLRTLSLDIPQAEPDVAQPININVAPVFNVGGSHSESSTHEAHGKTGEGASGGDGLHERGPPLADDASALDVEEAMGGSGGEPEPAQAETGEVNEASLPEGPPADTPAETAPDNVDSGNDAVADEAAEDLGSAADGPAGGGLALYSDDGQDGPSAGDADYALDADFAEIGDEAEGLSADLGAELLEDYSAPPRPAPEPAPQPQDHFYGLDDLDRVRKLRIGDVAVAAETRMAVVEAEAQERDGEFAALQAFVVTNLDKHTGAFTLQDPESLASYHRWVALDSAHHHLFAIDRERKAKTAFLLGASREEVVAFDPEENWP